MVRGRNWTVSFSFWRNGHLASYATVVCRWIELEGHWYTVSMDQNVIIVRHAAQQKIRWGIRIDTRRYYNTATGHRTKQTITSTKPQSIGQKATPTLRIDLPSTRRLHQSACCSDHRTHTLSDLLFLLLPNPLHDPPFKLVRMKLQHRLPEFFLLLTCS